jgi:16S rRNA (cytosine1402-N4)-methyltransferase
MTAADRTAGAAGGHRPVMLREVLEVLNPRNGGIYVDGTFGAGGYSRALLDAADCTVWGVDRDPDSIATGASLAQRYQGRLNLITGRFGDMAALLNARGVDATDGVALDIGVSSMQIDRPERGFSFRADGPLDMRMEKQGESAADVVNGRSERELADIIHDYGEERRARAIARAIVAARQAASIAGTLQLAEIVRRAFGGKSAGGIDPATRTFQALRIYVNDELGEIDRGMLAAEALLRSGGRMAVVTFHSLEDRRVKRFLRLRSGRSPQQSRHRPQRPASWREPDPSFRLLPANGTVPTADEVRGNPRARSARLRAAERTAAPAWPRDRAAEVAP